MIRSNPDPKLVFKGEFYYVGSRFLLFNAWVGSGSSPPGSATLVTRLIQWVVGVDGRGGEYG